VSKSLRAWMLLYGAGAVALCAWSLFGFLAETVGAGTPTLRAALPAGWILGFWPVIGPLEMTRRVWRLQEVLDEHCARRARGLDGDVTGADVEEALVTLAVREHALPEAWARRAVRLMIARAPWPDEGAWSGAGEVGSG